MKLHQIIVRRASASIGIAGILAVTACGGGGGDMTSASDNNQMTPPTTTSFTDTALVVDKAEVVATAATIDGNLQNPWGIAIEPGFPFWIADNNSNLATLYSGTGEIETQAITGSPDVGIAIPASAAGVQANPTGQVYNGSGGFLVNTSKGPETALFMYDGEGGTIAAWAKDSGSSAVTAYDDGVANGTDHAVYKGLALATVDGASYLYATDLHNNKVDVFDTNFAKPAAMQGKFLDPGLPSGYVPFGIAALDGQLYVSFAKQDLGQARRSHGGGIRIRRHIRLRRQLRQPFRIGGRAQRSLGNGNGAQRIRHLRRGRADRQFRRRDDQRLRAQWHGLGRCRGPLDGGQRAGAILRGPLVARVRQRRLGQAGHHAVLYRRIRRPNGRRLRQDNRRFEHGGRVLTSRVKPLAHDERGRCEIIEQDEPVRRSAARVHHAPQRCRCRNFPSVIAVGPMSTVCVPDDA